jgi:hypothetical protein
MHLRMIVFLVVVCCVKLPQIYAIHPANREKVTETLKNWGFSLTEVITISLRDPFDPLSDERCDFSTRGFEGLFDRNQRGIRSDLSEADLLLIIPALLEAGYDPNVIIHNRPVLFHFLEANDIYPRVLRLLLSCDRVDSNFRTRELSSQTALSIIMNRYDVDHPDVLTLLNMLLERCTYCENQASGLAERAREAQSIYRRHLTEHTAALAMALDGKRDADVPVLPYSKMPGFKKEPNISENASKIPGMPQDILRNYIKNYKYIRVKNFIKKYGPWGLFPAGFAAFAYIDYKVSKAYPNSWWGRRWHTKNEKHAADRRY